VRPEKGIALEDDENAGGNFVNLAGKHSESELSDFPLRIEFRRNTARITNVTDGGTCKMPIISPVKIKPPARKGDSGKSRALPGRWHN